MEPLMSYQAGKSPRSDRSSLMKDASEALTRSGRRRRRGRLANWTLEGLEARVLLSGGPPMVVTDAAQSITMSGATLEATVKPNGATTTPEFQYSTTPSFTPTVAT